MAFSSRVSPCHARLACIRIPVLVPVLVHAVPFSGVDASRRGRGSICNDADMMDHSSSTLVFSSLFRPPDILSMTRFVLHAWSIKQSCGFCTSLFLSRFSFLDKKLSIESHLATLTDPDIQNRPLPLSPPTWSRCPRILNHSHNIHTLVVGHLSKHDVLAVEERRGRARDEELAPVRVGSGVGHAQQARARVFVRKVLVGKRTVVVD